MKGKLKKWLKANGKNALGKTLDLVGESTNIPIASKLLEGIGEALMDDPELTEADKIEVAEMMKFEIELLRIEQENLTDRWKSDNEQDLKFPRLIRPIVLAYSWVVITLIIILEACHIELPSSSIIIGMCGTVNVAYFGSRGYEKIIKYKNKRK